METVLQNDHDALMERKASKAVWGAVIWEKNSIFAT